MDGRIINNLYELIFKSEIAEPGIREYYDKLQPNIAHFAEQFHIARIDIRVEVEPNVYEVRGRVDTFTNFYHDEADGLETAMTLEYPTISHTKGKAVFFPWKGYVWSEEEKKQIEAVSKLVNISLSRCNMIRYQQEAPYIDLLTGLVNNEGIIRFGRRIEKSVKMSDYAGLFINLKNFKILNQQLTQPGANTVMREYALRLYNFLDTRKEMVARLGGDNFFALVRKAHMEEFMALAMNMSLTTEKDGQSILVNVRSRVGVYLAREKDTIEVILNHASFAFQRAKRGQQTVSYFDEDLMNDTMRAKKVSMLIPEALEKGEFIPLYQPKVRASNSRLYGCEALCRWIHEGKMVSPGEFIPVAEMTGL
ncbi:MAG: diguanylate cyclase, partial [Clostridia bacterium]|nr:diguanylate cyclase [Clostridia bacterium]